MSKVDGNLSAFNSYKDFDDEGDIAEHSLSKLIASTNPDLDEEIKTLIFASAKAIHYSATVPQQHRQRRVRCRNEHLHGTGQPVVK